MRVALLNLISTPAAMLPELGLQLCMGLSSDDPMVGRHPPEPYDAYVSVYAPDGTLADRLSVGRIPPHRRQFVRVSELVRPFGFMANHLVVAHRIPASFADRYNVLDQPVDVPDETDYGFFRSYVQYGYPDGQGAHGSIIYEVPHWFNEPVPGRLPPIVLTFTTKIVLSESVTTHVMLLNYSTHPAYRTRAEYRYAVHAGDGSRVAGGSCSVGPFQVGAIDMSRVIPEQAVERARDPHDGLSHFCFYGICENATLAILVLNVAPTLRGVSLEHTHQTQAYLMVSTSQDQQAVKRQAVAQWQRLLTRATAAERILHA